MTKAKPYIPIRARVLARMGELNLSANAVAVLTKDKDGRYVVWPDHLRHFLAARKDMTADKLDAVFRVLGLRVEAGRGREGTS